MALQTSFQHACLDQAASPLFSRIPGEIRDRIFSHVLSCYEDTSKIYEKDTSYRRPNYLAPQRADTQLLQTCQQIYNEAWFRPWLSAVHTCWLAWEGRRPDKILTPAKLQETLDLVSSVHKDVELSHIRIFAQLCSLEPGGQLNEILQLRNFHPRVITITIRHHDWWYWEDDEPLFIGGGWVSDCKLPSSLLEFRLELESLKRKKDQIDDIAAQMVESWHFENVDGTRLCARKQDFQISTWTGSSTWEGGRWLRDETGPETLEYYVKTVVWKPKKTTRLLPEAPDLRVASTFEPIDDWEACLSVSSLQEAEVPAGCSADEARRLVNEFYGRSP